MKKSKSILIVAAFVVSSMLVYGANRPNVVIIMADDLGWADIGIQNEEATKDVFTPNIDKLFRSGLRFSNGYVANATCGPSRASMMTGRTSSRFRMEDNNELGVPADELMIPEMHTTARSGCRIRRCRSLLQIFPTRSTVRSPRSTMYLSQMTTIP